MLLEEEEWTVNPEGKAVERVRRVVRVLRPQGRKYGEVYATYSKGTKIRTMHAWSIGVDGREYTLKDSDTSDISLSRDAELYSDVRARVVSMPAVDPGTVVAVEFERESRPYVNEIVWDLQGDLPIARERLLLSLPPGFQYKAVWKGRKVEDGVDLEHGRTLWEFKDQLAIAVEDIPLAPDSSGLSQRLDVFYFGEAANGPANVYNMRGSWRDIGQWYEALARDRNQPDAAITAKAHELVAGRTDFRARVEVVAEFVQQQIRYYGIEIGVGGYQPHAAADIFRVRYGDCKDKATLLSAMLRAIDVRSTWVMVDTSHGVIAPESPSIAGNHMIAAIELPKEYTPKAMYSIVTANSGKRFLIFDPTWEKTPFGQLERELQGSSALLVDGADSQVITLPVLLPEQNRVEHTGTFKLDAQGGLQGSVVESRSGDIARYRREILGAPDPQKRQKYMDTVLSQDVGAFQLSNLQMTNLSELQRDFTVSYSLHVDHFAQSLGPLLTLRPRVLGVAAFPVDRKRRDVPIDLGETKRVHDEYAIELPPGYVMDELPGAVKLDVGFASYESQSTMTGNTLHYSRTYTVRSAALPADRYADVQKLAGVIATDEQSSAVLKRTN